MHLFAEQVKELVEQRLSSWQNVELNVTVASRDITSLNELTAELTSLGQGSHSAIQLDLENQDDIRSED